MKFNVNYFVSPKTLAVARESGIHKLGSALAGVDSLNIKNAVELIARKAFVKRAEAKIIKDGIEALKKVQ